MANSKIIGAGQDTARPAPKKILDACCGGRSMWFDKNDKRAIFCDIREEHFIVKDRIRKDGTKWHGWTLHVTPDKVSDFTQMDFENNTFHLVVFDPPHRTTIGGAVMEKQYGVLSGDWRCVIRKGFSECFRVLKPNGILIFKWNEKDILVRDILKLTDALPLFGNKSGKRAQTHWICFMKGEESPVLGEGSPAQNTIEICHTAPNTGSLKFFCCLGKLHPCPLNVNDGFCAAESCQYRVAEKLQAGA